MNSNTDIDYFQQKIKQIIYCNLHLSPKTNCVLHKDMDEMIELSKKTPYVNEMFYMLFQYLLDTERCINIEQFIKQNIDNMSEEIRYFIWKNKMINNLLESNSIQPNLKKIFLTVSDEKNEISFYETVFRSCLAYKCAYLTMELFKYRKIYVPKSDLIDFFKTIEHISRTSKEELIKWKKQNVYSFILERIVLCENQVDYNEYCYFLNIFLVLYEKSFLSEQIVFDKPPYLMLFLDILEWKIFEKIWREKVVALYTFMSPELQKKYNSFYMYKMRPHMGNLSMSPRTVPSPSSFVIEQPNKSRMLSFLEENDF